jgi:hypothetical protein
MPTNPFREQGAFEPEATAAMGEAFDDACKELCDLGQLQMVRRVVAQRIIKPVEALKTIGFILGVRCRPQLQRTLCLVTNLTGI